MLIGLSVSADAWDAWMLMSPPEARLTAPAKLLAPFKLIVALFAAVTLVVPPMLSEVPCVTAPPAVTWRLPPIVDTPSGSAPDAVIEAPLLPVFDRLTLPPKEFPDCVKLIVFAPAVKLDRPPTTIALFCAMAPPFELTVRFPPVPVLMPANVMPFVLATAMMFPPPVAMLEPFAMPIALAFVPGVANVLSMPALRLTLSLPLLVAMLPAEVKMISPCALSVSVAD